MPMILPVASLSRDDREVGAAQARARHSDDDLARPRVRLGHFLEFRLRLRLNKSVRAHRVPHSPNPFGRDHGAGGESKQCASLRPPENVSDGAFLTAHLPPYDVLRAHSRHFGGSARERQIAGPIPSGGSHPALVAVRSIPCNVLAAPIVRSATTLFRRA
jgi:hypothetical protein